MKKYLSLLCSAAIIALSLSGCAKNDTPDEDVQGVGVEKTVNFNANSPSTKSYFGEKTDSGYPTVWTSNTKVSVSVNYATGKAATVNPKGSGNTATFDVELTQPTADEFVFYALSPSSSAVSYSSTNKSIQVDFPASQSPTKGSVDEASHIMFAQSETFTEWPTETVDLKFAHLAAYGKFTLNNFREDGTAGKVKINSVDIESDSLIAGRFYFYPETKHFKANPGTNIITVKSDNIEYEHNNRDITFWFAVRPVDLSGSNMKITLNTTDGVFVKTFTFPKSAGNFQSGKVGTFEINMDGINPQEEEVYTLVTDYSVLKEDAKVIIAAAEADYAISTTQNGNNRAGAAVNKSIENDVSVIKNPSSAVQIFVLEQGTLENTLAFNCENGDQAGLYIGSPGLSGNYMRSFTGDSQEFTKGNCSFTVILKKDTESETPVDYAILKSNADVANTFMRFNAGSSNIFSLYTETSSVTGKVALYVLNGSGEGDPLVDAITDEPVIEFDETTNTVTITCPDETARIGYSIDGSEPGIDDQGQPLPGTLEYTAPFVLEETTTVKAFAGAEHKRISPVVSKECIVAGSYKFETVAELNALLTNSSANLYGKLTNAVVSFVPSTVTNTAIITDGTGSIMYYKANHGLKQGQTFSGEINVAAVLYNGLYSEITTMDATFAGSGEVVNPEVLTPTQLTGNYAKYQNTYAKFENVEVTAVSGKNVTVTDGTNTYIVYTNYGNATVTVGQTITAIGTITKFGSTEELKVWTSADISVAGAKYTVTFTQPASGGTFKVKVGGSDITSGTEVDPGTVVTLVASPVSGFKLGTWSVTGATVSGNTPEATFTMGNEDVTVTASFVQDGVTQEEITGTFTLADSKLSLTTTSGVTVVQEKGEGSSAVNANYNTPSTLRMYKGHTLTFSGKTFKKIEITVNGTYYGNGVTASTGTLTPTTTSGGTIVWEGSASSVTITNVANDANVQLRPSKIVVTY